MNFSVWIKMLALSLMIAGTAYGDPDSKKQIDFEGDVVQPGRIRGRIRRIITDRCYCKVVVVAQSKEGHWGRSQSR